ncbi:hypothetical protein J7X09_002515 [Vibrio parahaemolyticus]|nr:hypothetical protein [Vibrio parahaemolyticus]
MSEWKSTLVVGLLSLVVTNSLTFYLATESAKLEYKKLDQATRERSHELLMDITTITTNLYRQCITLEKRLNNYPQYAQEEAFKKFKNSTIYVCDETPLASNYLGGNDHDLAGMKLILQERLGLLQTANVTVVDWLNQYEQLERE